jgi:hypothetical protein
MKKRLALLVLACGLGAVPVAAQQQANMNLLLAAKTICFSDNSKVTWSKAGTEPDTHDIFLKMVKAASTAMKPFKVLSCEARPDLVLRIDYSDMGEYLTFKVTDATSGNPAWTDSRSVSDLSSDLYQLAHKFQRAVIEAQLAADRAIRLRRGAETSELQAKADALKEYPRLPHFQYVADVPYPLMTEEGATVGFVQPGEVVGIIGYQGDFAQIVMKDGTIGWAHKSYFKALAP